MNDNTKLQRPLLLLAMLTLLGALWAGLIRLGWSLPPLRPTLPMAHGPLMIAGFLGTLISLERAVALNVLFKSRWPYAVPLISGVGGILTLLGVAGAAGPALMTIGSAGLVILFYFMVRHHPAIFTIVMALGSVTLLVGNLLWLFGRPVSQAVWLWAGFLIFTIAGERLELSRMVRFTEEQQRLFTAVSAILLLGLIIAIFSYDVGVRISGLGMLGTALWLLRYDIARHTKNKEGLPRFIAICMLTGYVWLVVGGGLAIILGGVSSGLYYDAVLHAIYLGFTFAMIFGHAPIIFPAVLNLPVGYHPRFYVHLALLHISLLLRIIGDLALWPDGRAWGGMLNVIVLLLFLANMASAIWQGKNES
ncbi:MAG: hypothetical protein GY803_11120 [Chloroflexi bacterium]|nr:hypothetical protein [Chloroflexota bacterium]